MDTVRLGLALAVLLVVLVAIGAVITRAAGLGPWRQPVTASVRAVLQLAGISLIIAVVLRSLVLTALFLLLMVVAAAGTSARRVTGSLRPGSWWTALPIAAGAIPTVLIIAVSGAVPLAPVAVLPTAGILIGGAMTATSLAGRRVVDELDAHRGAYEAALSIGLSRREAVSLVARPAAATALVPGLDQTRTVGLVTLPGAFVGVLLAGASPWQAGATQLLVLVALVVVQVVAVAVTVELFSAGLLPAADGPLPE
ncbi:ABC transporter permease [Nakamurella flavida]|uniref:ABC transporter permease n=1 Tax=Nakamurella flavida TaxID=363630 RepID=A0A938YPD2_9ACTN|nr:ABC transporter permease [Nakamurella flavida]MBM9478256.1 ABC transporter permease [Nakamurella flavida]MDP9777573.1 putative ABC transport system permease protein [Nakamurella flavida]